MKPRLILGAMTSMLVAPAIAFAQVWVPGSEISGQSAQVTTNGITNTVYFDTGGVARIVSPGGNTVNGTWSAASGQLCLNTGAAQECWPYASAFQAGAPITLTSSCNAVSTWTANGVNPLAPPAARGGERG